MTTATMQARPGYTAPKLGPWGFAETVAWILIAGHVIHWAVDALYYIFTQVTYLTEAKHGQPTAIFGSIPPGDWWDRLTVHIANILGLHNSILNNNGAASPLWWITWRHDIRYVVIGVLAGVVITMLVSGPRAERRSYAWYRLAATPVLALAWALPGVLAGGLLIWRVAFLRTGGLTLSPSWGILGHEIGQWSSAGKIALVIIGLLGSQLFAKYASKGPADEAQWLYAGRKANKILHERTGRLAAVGNFTDAVVIGPPGYRSRVHYLVDNGIVSEASSEGVVVVLWLGAVLLLILAGYGAWLTLAGPAAGA
jgi:hypothetical protein